MSSTKNSPSPGARTTVRLPEHLHHRAKLASAFAGEKLQDFIATAVEEYLKQVESGMSVGLRGERKSGGTESA
jgi:predicted DNA binding CopG/RHH family protein